MSTNRQHLKSLAPVATAYAAKTSAALGRFPWLLAGKFIIAHFRRIAVLILLIALTVSIAKIWLGPDGAQVIKAYMSLPPYDYVGEGMALLKQEKLDQALVVVDAGLNDDSLSDATRESLRDLRGRIEAEKGSWLRIAKNVGYGALTGDADTLEGLMAVVATDFFVVGDVRDLAVQGKKWVMGEETDEFIVIISGIGIATTVAPWGDWVPAFLKAAKKAGVLSATFTKAFGKVCKAAVKTRDFSKIKAFGEALHSVVKHSSLTQAARLMRHVDDTADLTRLAGFLARNPRHGAFALQALDGDIVRQVANGKRILTAAEEGLLIGVAKKGRAGQAMWRKHRYLLNSHLGVGLAKGMYKGTIQNLLVKSSGIVGFDIALACIGGLGLVCVGMIWDLRRKWVRFSSVGRA